MTHAPTLITGGPILTPDQTLTGYTVLIEGSRITRLVPARELSDAEGIRLSAQGCSIAPGLIDVHVHGADGADTTDASVEALHRMSRFFARHGVTSFLPTTVTASAANIRAAINTVVQAPVFPDGAQPLGVHLEGPYLSVDYRGAQPAQHLRPANPEEYAYWLASGGVKLITVAPEIPGVLELIETGVARGVQFAAGHSGATYEQVEAAVERGLRQVTHTFNGMPPLHHRAPGLLGAALTDDRLVAQIIADGVHVHPVVIKLLVRSKGMDRILLVTDAMRATGLSGGDYQLGDQIIHVRDGIARTDSGSLAGSTLTLDQGLRNVMQYASLSLPQALPMATRVPAAALGLAGRKGILAPGADADLIFLDAALQVRLTMVGGKVVFNTLQDELQRGN